MIFSHKLNSLRALPIWLSTAVLLLLLTACGGSPADQPDPEDGAAAVVDTEGQGPSIQVLVPANDIPTGQPRVPFVLYDGPQQVTDAQAVTITAFDLSQTPPVPTWEGTAENYSDYAVPYWVVYPEVPTAGNWGLAAEITLADGSTASSQFAVEIVADPAAPTAGETVPASENRTLQTVDEIGLLTSATDPQPALYQMTVAEAVENDRPAVISFSTPAYCQTAVCAPVIDTIEATQAAYGDQIDFLHLEIYKEFDPLVVADEVNQWGLPSEPWTFVLDAGGTVAARLAGPVSERELGRILDELLSS